MQLQTLTAISPLDGRYRPKVDLLVNYFSEYALIRYRVWVEIEYYIALHEVGLPGLSPVSEESKTWLRNVYEAFGVGKAARVKEIEAVTNHDVKAVEYFLKEKLEKAPDKSLDRNKEFVHFGLTSQDINNTATPMMLRDALQEAYLPRLDEVIAELSAYAEAWKSIPMLARTHGQPASPTTLGKEFAVYVARLQAQRDELAAMPVPGKFGGATGNFNAHYIAYPDTDWEAFAEQFLTQQLGLSRSKPTTQIDHYDGLSRIFDALKRINTILIDLCQDCWLYISQEYFRQKVKKNEVGSSAMPHKVNPIDFENGEGNLGMSTAMLEFLSRKLPVSRLQRDLTDSTVLRNLGVGMGYSYLALHSIQRGLGKLLVNEAGISSDLNANWAILAEAIQTILRREGTEKPYELLKALTRGKATVTQKDLLVFIEGLSVSDAVKEELRGLTPAGYVGNAGG
ncbi:MAG: adenylosuccinate lyase [Bacteroidota bacterium]